MTLYRDFISDFPTRCIELLEKTSEWEERGVTKLLMVAASALVVPLERIAPSTRERYTLLLPPDSTIRIKYEELAGTGFEKSDLFAPERSDWRNGTADSSESDPNNWPALSVPTIRAETRVKDVLGTLRHALAHGNLWTDGGSTITRIVFIRGGKIPNRGAREPFEFVATTPVALRGFLKRWCRWLHELGVPNDLVVEDERGSGLPTSGRSAAGAGRPSGDR